MLDPLSLATVRSPLRVLGVVAGALLAAGCSSVTDTTTRMVSAVTPYKADVVQGNFVSREQVEAIKPGMTRVQVREMLGTPLVVSVFHGDRWDYVFTFQGKSLDRPIRRLTVWFDGDLVKRFDHDPMPTEAEFVSSLDVGRKLGPVPTLTATEDQLAKFPAPKPQAPASVAPGPRTYPPLEAPAR